jgi:hypothetical protein
VRALGKVRGRPGAARQVQRRRAGQGRRGQARPGQARRGQGRAPGVLPDAAVARLAAEAGVGRVAAHASLCSHLQRVCWGGCRCRASAQAGARESGAPGWRLVAPSAGGASKHGVGGLARRRTISTEGQCTPPHCSNIRKGVEPAGGRALREPSQAPALAQQAARHSQGLWHLPRRGAAGAASWTCCGLPARCAVHCCPAPCGLLPCAPVAICWRAGPYLQGTSRPLARGQPRHRRPSGSSRPAGTGGTCAQVRPAGPVSASAAPGSLGLRSGSRGWAAAAGAAARRGLQRGVGCSAAGATEHWLQRSRGHRPLAAAQQGPQTTGCSAAGATDHWLSRLQEKPWGQQ